MNKSLRKSLKVALIAGTVIVSSFAATALAHHSFAMYDTTKTVTFTGAFAFFRAYPGAFPLALAVTAAAVTARTRRAEVRSRFRVCTWDLLSRIALLVGKDPKSRPIFPERRS